MAHSLYMRWNNFLLLIVMTLHELKGYQSVGELPYRSVEFGFNVVRDPLPSRPYTNKCGRRNREQYERLVLPMLSVGALPVYKIL